MDLREESDRAIDHRPSRRRRRPPPVPRSTWTSGTGSNATRGDRGDHREAGLGPYGAASLDSDVQVDLAHGSDRDIRRHGGATPPERPHAHVADPHRDDGAHAALLLQARGDGRSAPVRDLRRAGSGPARAAAPAGRRVGVAVRGPSGPGVPVLAPGTGPGGEPVSRLAGRGVHDGRPADRPHPPPATARRAASRPPAPGLVRLAGPAAGGGGGVRGRGGAGGGDRAAAPARGPGGGDRADRPDDAALVPGGPLARCVPRRRRGPARAGPAADAAPAPAPAEDLRTWRRARRRRGACGRRACGRWP